MRIRGKPKSDIQVLMRALERGRRERSHMVALERARLEMSNADLTDDNFCLHMKDALLRALVILGVVSDDRFDGADGSGCVHDPLIRSICCASMTERGAAAEQMRFPVEIASRILEGLIELLAAMGSHESALKPTNPSADFGTIASLDVTSLACMLHAEVARRVGIDMKELHVLEHIVPAAAVAVQHAAEIADGSLLWMREVAAHGIVAVRLPLGGVRLPVQKRDGIAFPCILNERLPVGIKNFSELPEISKTVVAGSLFEGERQKKRLLPYWKSKQPGNQPKRPLQLNPKKGKERKSALWQGRDAGETNPLFLDGCNIPAPTRSR
jgi:hypothetical protein